MDTQDDQPMDETPAQSQAELGEQIVPDKTVKDSAVPGVHSQVESNAPQAQTEAAAGPPEVWVETKTDSGKSYYYHSVSRETTWTRPEGVNVRIVSQAELEQINVAKAAAVAAPVVSGNVPPLDGARHPILFGAPPPRFSLPPPMGMPPPGFGPPAWMIPGAAAPGVPAPVQTLPLDPALLAKASEWTEHKSPDGRTFYYNASKGQSVWEKPEILVQVEASRMAAVHSQQQTQHMPKSLPLMQHPPLIPLHHQPPMIPPQLGPPPGVLAPGAAWMQQVLVAEAQKRQIEERAKQELEERLRGQKAAPVDKSKPVSSTPITGTPWCVVWTGDARVFFYNPSTKVSVWERPDELADRADVTKAMSTVPEALLATHPGNVVPRAAGAQPPIATESVPATGHKDTDSEDDGEAEEEAGIPSKKFRVDDSDNRLQNATSAAEAEAQAAKERSTIPLEQRVTSFKEMLREKDVSAFSTWEKELHKIVFDQRYLLLPSRERKQVFDKYVKDRAEEERKEKRTKLKQKATDFRALMESAGLHGKSSFSEFAQKYAKDDRLRAVEKMRERESLFNEYIIEVRKREKEEAQQRREQAKLDFLQMLRKHPHVDRHCRWPEVRKLVENTKEYRALDSKEQREELFNEFCKQMREEKRRREKDRKGGAEEEDKVAPEAGEEADEEEAGVDEEEQRRRQKELERQLRAEASLREREKEVQRTLAEHLRERDNKREHHKKGEAIGQFTALLTDLVRNSDLTWKDVKRQLRKDHRYPMIEEALEREERERLFHEHIVQLEKKKRDKYRELLDEIPHLDMNTSWKEVKRIIRDDPRYLKYNSSEKCEREFREYLHDKTLDKTIAFRELLQECKLINHKSMELVRENPAHIHEIEDILRIDKRFLDLDHVPEERQHMIYVHLEDLFKRGPPPPPTAATATRRKPQ